MSIGGILNRLGDATTEDFVTAAIATWITGMLVDAIDAFSVGQIDEMERALVYVAIIVLFVMVPVFLVKMYRQTHMIRVKREEDRKDKKLEESLNDRKKLVDLRIRAHERKLQMYESLMKRRMALIEVQVNAIRRKSEFFWLSMSREMARQYVKAVEKQSMLIETNKDQSSPPPSSSPSSSRQDDLFNIDVLDYDERDEIDQKSELLVVAMERVASKADDLIREIDETPTFNVSPLPDEEVRDDELEVLMKEGVKVSDFLVDVDTPVSLGGEKMKIVKDPETGEDVMIEEEDEG